MNSSVYLQRVKAFVVDEAHCVVNWYVNNDNHRKYFYYVPIYSNFNRGETFRGTLLRLGEIRSFQPEGVPIMALTATATQTLQHEIARILGMRGPTVISVSPCKINIMYALAAPYHSISITFRPILMRLKKEGVKVPRIIIYCRKYEECADLHIFFR